MSTSQQTGIALKAITSDDNLFAYATGSLSLAKHVMITCQAEISDKVSQKIGLFETIAASALEDVETVSLSDNFMDNVIKALPARHAVEQDNLKTTGLAPRTLRNILGHGLKDMKWKSLVPGVAVHDVLGNRRYEESDRIYLLKAKGGMQMPLHGHKGEEWSLVLTGSYTVGDQTYERGDLHIEDESEIHAPHINEGEDCICLIMTEGPLVMQDFLPKVVQKVVGI